MINSVIFDFGQVLVRFDPKYMVEQYVKDPEDSLLLQKTVFDRLYWDKLDAGTITDEETVCEIKKRIPERLHEKAEEIYYNWIYNIPEIDGMREVVELAREKFCGRVYLLSNISVYFAEHSFEIPILKYMSGCVFSATAGFTKPNADIFRHICEKFDLLPQNTLFIDDSEKNIKGAEAFGINGYLFDGDSEKLKKFLKKL
jgi:putative hydrolase of the HAD superfamily